MSKDNIVAAAVLAAVALYFYSDIKQAFKGKPLTQEQAVNAITSAGGTVIKQSTGDYWQVDGGVVKLTEGWTPNFAQKLLIGVDKVIPSDWLTRKVLGV